MKERDHPSYPALAIGTWEIASHIALGWLKLKLRTYGYLGVEKESGETDNGRRHFTTFEGCL